MSWLQRQFALADAEYAAYPEWKKRAYAVPVDPSEADTDEWPADPCVIPPEAMHAEGVPVIEGKRMTERCQCGHLWHQHWVSFGCQFCNCMKEQQE